MDLLVQALGSGSPGNTQTQQMQYKWQNTADCHHPSAREAADIKAGLSDLEDQ